ncbi:SGNH/GDSL hydrolase family protein, partial [Micromonospora zhanjiangensis]
SNRASTPAVRPPAGVLAQVHTAGRVKDLGPTVRYTWPGVYFEGRFRGTGVGLALDDAVNDYDVQVDGATVATLVTPGRTTRWITGLTRGTHTVRLVKRTESPAVAGAFGGLRAVPGGAVLSPPAARHRQIEFIGDSYTAGYGNMSTTRDCSAIGGVDRNSDADLAFGAITARRLGADYQVNAKSGFGVVRNYNGALPEVDYRTYYDRVLQEVSPEPWRRPAGWRPQLVVVGLGINDFSTPLHAGERWATTDQLVADYTTSYLGFVAKLRARYGPRTTIVLSATAVGDSPVFADAVRRAVRERNARGDDRVRYWYYDDPGLDRLGCDWHPSLHDHRIIADQLDSYLATLPLAW